MSKTQGGERWTDAHRCDRHAVKNRSEDHDFVDTVAPDPFFPLNIARGENKRDEYSCLSTWRQHANSGNECARPGDVPYNMPSKITPIVNAVTKFTCAISRAGVGRNRDLDGRVGSYTCSAPPDIDVRMFLVVIYTKRIATATSRRRYPDPFGGSPMPLWW